jgi:hypothetical protein
MPLWDIVACFSEIGRAHVGKTGNNVPQRHRKNRQQCPTEALEKQATMSHRGIGKTGNNVPQRHRKNRQQCPTEALEKQATMSHRGIGKTGNNVPQRHRKNRQQCPTEASEKQATVSLRGIGKTGNNVPQRHRKNRKQWFFRCLCGTLLSVFPMPLWDIVACFSDASVGHCCLFFRCL